MSTFQIGGNFLVIEDGMVSVSSQDSNYPKKNMLNLANLRRHYRTATVTAWKDIIIDFGSARVVRGVMLNDVNFMTATIQGTNTSFISPEFSLPVTISIDERVNRRKIFTTLSGFIYRYLRVAIPFQTPTDGASYFRVGTLVCAGSVLEFASNPSYPYQYSAPYPEPKAVRFPTGGIEQVDMGSYKVWKGAFSFQTAVKTTETDMWTLAALKPTDYLIFAENRGDSSKAYLCKQSSMMEIEEIYHNIFRTNSIELGETI